MDIEVLIIDEEALAHRRVTVLIRLQVEFDLIRQQRAFVGTDDLPLVREDGAAMPILLLLELLHNLLLGQRTGLHHYSYYLN